MTMSLAVVALQSSNNNRIAQGGFYNHLTKTVIIAKMKSRGLLPQNKNKVSKYPEKPLRPLSSRKKA